MSANIYITGFMGSGKTTVGRSVAERLCAPFSDMDELLEERLGAPVREVFARLGEGAFRKAETRLLRKLARRRGLVVATGGGVPVSPVNRALMRYSGKIVHLAAHLETCRERMGEGEAALRPLWSDVGALGRLFDGRLAAYADCDAAVPVDGLLPEAAARGVISALFPEQRLAARLGGSGHPVVITHDAPAAVSELVSGRRVMVVTDATVARLHLRRIREAIGGAPPVVIIPPGERGKRPEVARKVWEALLAARFSRDEVLLGVGGGAVTDLSAFCAATYKRGMASVLVSTTLLGCVDAALGGKAAVNLGPVKNSVGCFTVPEGVVLDCAALATLPASRLRDGLIEAYKTGLAVCGDLAETVEAEAAALLSGDRAALGRVVALSARAKLSVVAEDFREGGRRMVLNLGHTFGHAVEAWNRFRVSHGVAVAEGMRVAAAISEARGLLSPRGTERIFSLLSILAPARAPLPPADAAWGVMENDKKVRGGRLAFVLPTNAGETVCATDVTRGELASAIARAEGTR